jgi:hypothetical protein
VGHTMKLRQNHPRELRTTRLPPRRLGKSPFAIGKGYRELARCQVTLPDPLEEGGVLPQFPAVELVWVEDSYTESEFLGDDADDLIDFYVARPLDRTNDSLARLNGTAVSLES